METLSNVYAPYIGANGNWYVDNEDTGVKAQGPKGDEGPVGGCGAQGLRGPKGETGDRGPQGIQGPAGATGVQGVKGDKGDQGPKGDTPELIVNLQENVEGKALDATMGKVLDAKIAVSTSGIDALNYKLDMNGSHTVYTVFGVNSGSTIATGFIPFHNANTYNINITSINIPGVGELPPTTALEIVGRSKSGINIRSISTYASSFKGNTAFITFTATLIN